MVENRRRTTKQRLAIRALFDDEPFFLTAQQVHDQLRNRGDQVGLATVYRNLQTMAEDGELDAIRAEDGEMTLRRLFLSAPPSPGVPQLRQGCRNWA